MEIIEVIGIDPSLRHTGIAKVIYNLEKNTFSAVNCTVVNCPPKFKGLDAIKYSLEKIEDIASEACYSDACQVVIESPPNVFNPKFPVINFIQCAHIVGGAAALFGLDRSTFCAPINWNKKNKAQAHINCFKQLGEWKEWNFTQKPCASTMEHIIDAVCIAFWYINKEYIENV